MKQLFKIGIGIKIYSVINCLFLIFYGMCTDYVVIISKKIYLKALNPLKNVLLQIELSLFRSCASGSHWQFLFHIVKKEKKCHQKCNCEVKKKWVLFSGIFTAHVMHF